MTPGFRARCLCSLLLAALLPALPGPASSADAPTSAPATSEEAPDSLGRSAADVGAATLDVLVLRPIGFIASACGLGFFAVSAPFVAPSRDFATSWEIFVEGPAEYTFERPLGEF